MLRNRLPIVLVCLLAGCTQPTSTPTARTAGDADPKSSQAEVPPRSVVEPAAPSAASNQVELQILDLGGLERLISSHRGKVVVVDAWSTSCEPCLREFPNLVAMSREIGPERLACVSLCLDYDGLGKPEDKRAKVLSFLERFGATFDNVLSSDEADRVFERLEFFAPPAVFVYDRDGKLSKKFDASAPGGHFTYADVRRQVESLLASEGRSARRPRRSAAGSTPKGK